MSPELNQALIYAIYAWLGVLGLAVVVCVVYLIVYVEQTRELAEKTLDELKKVLNTDFSEVK